MFKFMCQPPSDLRPTLAFLQGDAVNTDSGSDDGTAKVSNLRLNAHTNAAVADPPFPVRVWLPPLEEQGEGEDPPLIHPPTKPPHHLD